MSLICRVIATVWGIITVVVGTFIFGQSTTIAVMELLQKLWVCPPIIRIPTIWSSRLTVTSERWTTLICFAQMNVAFVCFFHVTIIYSVLNEKSQYVWVFISACKVLPGGSIASFRNYIFIFVFIYMCRLVHNTDEPVFMVRRNNF